MNSTRVPWRFRLNKLAVQITLLIFVSIVAFQTIVIGMFHVFGRRHIVDQGDFIASIILALDVAPLCGESQCHFSALSRRSLRQYRDSGGAPSGGEFFDGRRRSRL